MTGACVSRQMPYEKCIGDATNRGRNTRKKTHYVYISRTFGISITTNRSIVLTRSTVTKTIFTAETRVGDKWVMFLSAAKLTCLHYYLNRPGSLLSSFGEWWCGGQSVREFCGRQLLLHSSWCWRRRAHKLGICHIVYESSEPQNSFIINNKYTTVGWNPKIIHRN